MQQILKLIILALISGGFGFVPSVGFAKSSRSTIKKQNTKTKIVKKQNRRKPASKKQIVKNMFRNKGKSKRNVASFGLLTDGGESTSALKVRGQSRNLNMLLVLKSKQDKISFIKLKKDYNEEILGTNF